MDLFELLGKARGSVDKEPAQPSVEIDLDSLGPDNVPVHAADTGAEMLQALRAVIDPELGVNIVDLGLVYALELVDGRADVVLTMTTPACPLSAVIEDQVKDALYEADPALSEVRVAVVFEPAWSPAMMSDTARRQLGG